MTALHADVVGSLLRPSELLAAQADHVAGKLDAAGLRAAEDRAVDTAIAMQEAAGLPVLTDGEQRRVSFQSVVPEALDGFAGLGLDSYLWGEWRSEAGALSIARPAELAVVGKLRRRRWFVADEFAYLHARTRRLAKVTLPSPSLLASYWSPAYSRGAYASVEAFLADLVDLYREEVAELARRGGRYVQIDAPHYPLSARVRFAARRLVRGAAPPARRQDGDPRIGHQQVAAARDHERAGGARRRRGAPGAARAARAEPAMRLRIVGARQSPHCGRPAGQAGARGAGGVGALAAPSVMEAISASRGSAAEEERRTSPGWSASGLPRFV